MSHSNRGDASFDLHEVFGASGWMEGEGLDRSYRNDQRDGDSGISGGLENSSGQNQLLHPWFNRSQSRSVTRSVSLGSGYVALLFRSCDKCFSPLCEDNFSATFRKIAGDLIF